MRVLVACAALAAPAVAAAADVTLYELTENFCPADPRPSPKLADDFAWLEVVRGQPTGRCIDVGPAQMNLGRSVVRFEITFGD
jgi:hypothetical protein